MPGAASLHDESVVDLAAYERERDAAAIPDTAALHFNHRTLLSALIVAYAVAALGDALTTWMVLGVEGLDREANPIMRDAIAFYGLEPVLVMRVVVGVLLVWLLARVSLRGYVFFRMPREHPRRWLRRGDRWYRARARSYAVMLVVATAVTWLVVGNNLRAVLTLGG
jgi:hypothetical protein